MAVKVKRVYDAPTGADGHRVLVDRLWPRGLRRDDAQLDEWLKDVAPSPDLRTWWSHDPDRFAEFTERYRAELDTNEALEVLRTIVAGHGTTTLLFGARDPEVNHAVVLAAYLVGE